MYRVRGAFRITNSLSDCRTAPRRLGTIYPEAACVRAARDVTVNGGGRGVSEAGGVVIDRAVNDCALCRRSVLIGEPLTPFHDPRGDRELAVCDLCRGAARARGWTPTGAAPRRGRGMAKLRVERPQSPRLSAPQAAVLERVIGLDARPLVAPPVEALRERIRLQALELSQLRSELQPSRLEQLQRELRAYADTVRGLRRALRDREQHIERLERARHAETSSMRMCGHALDAFNQSDHLDRMARIARTLGEPVINIHDEGPGIPRRVRLTLCWEIAWYEYLVKVDLGTGRGSVHVTGSGGDAAGLPRERRRSNASWSSSGIRLS